MNGKTTSQTADAFAALREITPGGIRESQVGEPIRQAASSALAEIQNLRAQVEHGSGFPWAAGRLADWSIVGMNHYRQDGERRLFVSMEKHGRCIKAEGLDNGSVWAELERQAYRVRETPI